MIRATPCHQCVCVCVCESDLGRPGEVTRLMVIRCIEFSFSFFIYLFG